MLAVQGITPFALCSDIATSIRFYESLGFRCGFKSAEPGYAYMHCEGGAIRLLATDDTAALTAVKQHMIYIDVASADAFWEKYSEILLDLPETHRRAPFNQSYGQREVHVIDPDGTLLFFGQALVSD